MRPLLSAIRTNLARLGIPGLVVGIVVGVFLASFFASAFPQWTGFAADELPSSALSTPVVLYQQEKTLWDWMQLLLVPAVLAGGGYWLTRAENRYALELQERRELEARKIEEHRIQEAQKIEEQRAQDAALQSYLDQMTVLLLHEKLRTSKPEDEVRSVARARTLTVLKALNGSRKGRVVQFLYEAQLIGYENRDSEVFEPVFYLTGADLSQAYLRGLNLSGAVLYRVTLTGADLLGSTLAGANLYEADLSNSNLFGADLSRATLRNARLTGARLEALAAHYTVFEGAELGAVTLNGVYLEDVDFRKANLRGAQFERANLRGANLKGADLKGANLAGANLEGANLEDAHLERANLEGAKLKGAKLKGALLYKIDLQKADLSEELEDGFVALEPILLEAYLKTTDTLPEE